MVVIARLSKEHHLPPKVGSVAHQTSPGWRQEPIPRHNRKQRDSRWSRSPQAIRSQHRNEHHSTDAGLDAGVAVLFPPRASISGSVAVLFPPRAASIGGSVICSCPGAASITESVAVLFPPRVVDRRVRFCSRPGQRRSPSPWLFVPAPPCRSASPWPFYSAPGSVDRRVRGRFVPPWPSIGESGSFCSRPGPCRSASPRSFCSCRGQRQSASPCRFVPAPGSVNQRVRGRFSPRRAVSISESVAGVVVESRACVT